MNAVALGGTSTLSTCQKSTDGGMTWVLTGQPAFSSVDSEFPGQACDAAHGHGIADGDGTILTLLHEQFFDEFARDRHNFGWTGAIDKLERLFA